MYHAYVSFLTADQGELFVAALLSGNSDQALSFRHLAIRRASKPARCTRGTGAVQADAAGETSIPANLTSYEELGDAAGAS